MRSVPTRAGVLALLLLAAPASADIVLNGFFHTGDEDDRPEFTPADPVDCTRYRANPTRFHLTTSATITGFTLHDAVGLGVDDITMDIDGTQRSALTCAGCLADGTVTITLTTGISLGAGDHEVAVIDPSGISTNCTNGNDFGWSKLTLVSTGTTDSIMLSQRRQIGDDNDSDDDYDITDTSSPWYPDNTGGSFVDIPFTLAANRRLTEVKLYRLRDLDIGTAQVLVDGTFIGNLADTGDPLEANPTTLSTSFLLTSGAHTLRIQTANISAGNLDTFSWDDIILRFASTFSVGTPGFFNAVDVGGNALTGSITTKTAGGAFTLDLYALNGLGSGQDTTYNGGATVEVLNASNNSGTTDVYGCNSAWTLAQTLPSVTFVGGKAQVSSAFLDAGLKEARIRVTDSTTGAQGCSIDNFAIRPATLGVVPSQGSETTAGLATALTNAASSGLPRHRAGQPFTIVATGRTGGGAPVTNYDGSPTATTPVVIAPATVVGTLSLGSWGTASGGARRTDTATYSEVGAVTIGLEDTAWANVDADDTAASQRTITGTVNTGRFVPDHFKVTDGTLNPTCPLGLFSYLGSTLTWATPAVTLTAETAGNTTTLNYQGTLETLPDSLAQATYATYDDPAAPGTPTLNTAGLPVPAISAANAGVATVTLPGFSFARDLIGDFNAEVGITLPAFTDGDGIAPTESPIVIGSATAGGGIAFAGNGKAQRFGRLYFEPKYGSERLPMNVALRAEYFDGVSFRPNTADACTNLATGSVTLTPLGGQTHVVNPGATSGSWIVTLSAPNVPGQASMSIDLASPPVSPAVPYPLLAADTNADGTYADDPAVTVTFGLHAGSDKRIYMREVVGN